MSSGSETDPSSSVRTATASSRQQHLGARPRGRALTYGFDAPDQSYGVCYLGTTLACCLLETVTLRKRRRSRTLIIDAGVLNQRYAAYATVRRALRLAWLADAGLVRNGIDTRITGGDKYTASRRWSKACHDHASQLDGILYPSRRENTLYSVALFDTSATGRRMWYNRL